MRIFVLILLALFGIPFFLSVVAWFFHLKLREKRGAPATQPPPQPAAQPAASGQPPTQAASKKKEPGQFGLIATVLTTMVAIAFVGFWAYNEWVKPKPAPRPPAKTTTSSVNPPWEVVEPYFSGCESGDGTPGSGKHFRDKQGGGLEVVRGPQVGGANAVGYLQINVGDPRVVKFLLKNDLFVESVENSEEDNRRAGKLLYEDYLRNKGPHPWRKSSGCWGPLLVQRGLGRESYTKVVTAPTGDFSQTENIPDGYHLFFDQGENTIAVVWNDKEEDTLHPDTDVDRHDIRSVSVKSMMDRPIDLEFVFTPI